MMYAGVWKRFCAVVVDSVILTGVILIMIFLGSILRAMIGLDEGLVTLFVTICYFALCLLYFPLMESSSRQATIGKIAMGLRVTDLSGNRISFGKALVRHLCKILFNTVLYLGSIMIIFTEKKQGLYDIVAGTLVIRDKSPEMLDALS
ncbi:RDD family protein [Desulfosarcina sp. OttesenSCG-928-B08]|nr:RDD family protein [Desulfosarcina sp. OttesenSCG-928-B08]